MKALALLLLLGVSAYAQTAKVVQLSPEDAAEAKSLYEQKAAIERRIAELQMRVSDNYLLNKEHPLTFTACKSGMSCSTISKKSTYEEKYYGVLDGWQSGFEFSEDFKFIVPKKSGYTLDIAIPQRVTTGYGFIDNSTGHPTHFTVPQGEINDMDWQRKP